MNNVKKADIYIYIYIYTRIFQENYMLLRWLISIVLSFSTIKGKFMQSLFFFFFFFSFKCPNNLKLNSLDI